MVAMLAIGITLGVCLGATLWEVIFCDPLRRQNDELRLQMVRKDLRRAADRFGYIDYRLQHKGTPYLSREESDRIKREWARPIRKHDTTAEMRTIRDNLDHSKTAELRVV